MEGAIGRILFDNKPGDSFTKHLEKKGGRYIIRYRDIPTVDHTKFQPEQKAQRGKGETKREKKKKRKKSGCFVGGEGECWMTKARAGKAAGGMDQLRKPRSQSCSSTSSRSNSSSSSSSSRVESRERSKEL